MQYTEHAKIRMKQRGVSDKDLQLVLEVGEHFGDGYAMTNKAIDEYQQKLKKQLQRLDHLRGHYIVVSNDSLITTYHPSLKSFKHKNRE